jgi:F5/8 type C domain
MIPRITMPFVVNMCAGVLLTTCCLHAQTIVVDATPSHVVNSFSPMKALGAGVDRLRSGEGAPKMPRQDITKEEVEQNTDKLLSGPILKAILGAGWQPVTYRQNTELQTEAWHWNPNGTWSNPKEKNGYFTGSANPTAEIRHSWAYPLPHRGNTEGDSNEWSRLTDGNLASYWKSNPYLTRAFTGEADSLHPQWVLIDLGKKTSIDAIRIAWANPYATNYLVQFWTGDLEPFYDGVTKGTWQIFPKGTVTNGRGGAATLKLVDWTIPVRYIRIWMTRSSNTCDTHGSQDKRNCMGYAINELYAGTTTQDGQFSDVIHHVPSRKQTVTWTSSTDPWHATSDIDYTKGDQIGFDYFFHSGVTRGLPAIVPIAILYATPQTAANEIAYLYKRHYPVSWIEMGEEADGERMLPEDYAALYLQFATAIHKLVPSAKLGGPSFEGTSGDVQVWPDAQGRASFLGRFLDYLKAHDRLSDFTFFSFEHYPDIDRWDDLYSIPARVDHIVHVWKDDGLPANVPYFMTEGNMKAPDVLVSEWGEPSIEKGIWLADYVGAMMTAGASGTYYFHYIPTPGRPGPFLMVDLNYRVVGYPSQYITTQLINRDWVEAVDATHRLYRATSDVKDDAGNVLVTAYPILRPDEKWAVMLVNKDRDHSHAVRVEFQSSTQRTQYFSGAVEQITFGAAQYHWERDDHGLMGIEDPDGPPVRSKVQGSADTLYDLPAASVTVLRGNLSGGQ